MECCPIFIEECGIRGVESSRAAKIISKCQLFKNEAEFEKRVVLLLSRDAFVNKLFKLGYFRGLEVILIY